MWNQKLYLGPTFTSHTDRWSSDHNNYTRLLKNSHYRWIWGSHDHGGIKLQFELDLDLWGQYYNSHTVYIECIIQPDHISMWNQKLRYWPFLTYHTDQLSSNHKIYTRLWKYSSYRSIWGVKWPWWYQIAIFPWPWPLRSII